jgi:hypothetical protein
MAITVDWGTRVITVPQSFLDPLGGSVYQLNTENFKIAINDIEDSELGVVNPQIINHSTKVSLGGIEYARVLEIINGYTVTFEDGSYVVNLIGSNNNILDVTNLNQVQVRSNNSAGLINLSELQNLVFQNQVWVDQSSPNSGTVYPVGTPIKPVNNFADARTIALARGFDTIHITGTVVMDTGDDVSGFIIIGSNATTTQVTINDGAETSGCDIREAFVTGNLDGNTILRNCVIQDLNYVNGFVFKCMLNPGTIRLGGVTTAHFLDCYSGIPGTGTPTIDMNGIGNDQDTPLAMRNYNGGITLIDKTGIGAVSIDLASGQVRIENTCTNGTIVVRGDGKVVDADTEDNMQSGTYNGALSVINEVQYGAQVQEVYQRLGLDKNNPLTNNDDGSLSTGNVIIDAAPSGTSIIQTRRP